MQVTRDGTRKNLVAPASEILNMRNTMRSKEMTSTRVISEIWCHQCKMKKPKIVCCDDFFKDNKHDRCNGKYCESCVRRHYGTTVDELGQLPEWKCFRCSGTCLCANCKRDRGEDIPVKKRRRKKAMYKEFSNSQSLSEMMPTHLKDSVKQIISSPTPQKRPSRIVTFKQDFLDFDMLVEAASSRIDSSEETSMERRHSMPSISQDSHCGDCTKKVFSLRKELASLKGEMRELRRIFSSQRPQLISTPLSMHSEAQLPLPIMPLILPKNQDLEFSREVPAMGSFIFSTPARITNPLLSKPSPIFAPANFDFTAGY